MTGALQWWWLAGFVGFCIATWRVVSSGRAVPTRVVPRAIPVAIALGAVLLGATGAHVWGVSQADRGFAQMRAGTAAAPRARLFLRHVTVSIPRAESATIGYSADAAFRLPLRYRLMEADRGWDVLRVERRGSELAVTVVVSPEPTTTRVRLFVAEGSEQVRPCLGAMASGNIVVGRDIVVQLCRGTTPIVQLSLEVAHVQAETLTTIVSPRVWDGRRFRRHHLQIASGDMLQLGLVSGAVPGLSVWELPAPKGRAQLLFAPEDVLADCTQWRDHVVADSTREATRARLQAVCVLPPVGPFALEVRRLVPDTILVARCSLWAVALIVTPIVLVMLVFAAQVRSRRRMRELAGLCALATLSIFLAVVFVWRLLWAHRIDMLRNFESVGPRVELNLVLVVLVAAALAGTIATTSGQLARRLRLPAGVLAWLGWLAMGTLALPGGLGALPRSGLLVAVSLVVVLGPWLLHRCGRVFDRGKCRPWLSAGVGILVVFTVAMLANGFVAAKLLVAWTAVVVCCDALRGATLVGARDSVGRIVFAASCAACAFYIDPGLAVVLVLPGVIVASVMYGHDACYVDTSLSQVSSYRRGYEPLLWFQVIAFSFVAVGGTVWMIVSVDVVALPQKVTTAATHVLVFAVVANIAAVCVCFRRFRRISYVTAALALLLLLVWVAREALIECIVSSDAQAAHRISLVLDPGYALLRNDTKFLAGIAAWKEAIVPPGVSMMTGQGYFGAQLLDPGVLLSVDNDYVPVLLAREGGLHAVLSTTVLLLCVTAWMWLVAGDRFRHGSCAQRRRVVVTVVFGLLCVYQPLAAFGVLPLTGVAWPGFGIDSPSDIWMVVVLSLWVVVWRLPAGQSTELDELDQELRNEPRFRRMRGVAGLGALVAVVCSLVIVGCCAAFALRRPPPVQASGDSLASAIAYAKSLSCAPDASTGERPNRPGELKATVGSQGARRFHRALAEAWRNNRSQAATMIARWLRGQPVSSPARGWRVNERVSSTRELQLRFRFGWPQLTLTISREGQRDPQLACNVDLSSGPLTALRVPEKQPFRGATVRLVSKASGASAQDQGELISGRVVVRMRPGGAVLNGVGAGEGSYHASEVMLADGVVVVVAGSRLVLQRDAHARVRLFTAVGERNQKRHRRWRRVELSTVEQPLENTSLIVVDNGLSPGVWLVRRPAAWKPGQPRVLDPVLADDMGGSRASRRRRYVYGGLLPELGWDNRYAPRRSLGLDGWVRVALAEHERRPRRMPHVCGTLAPPVISIDDVCRPSPHDGVLECRVTIQPELAIQLRHLTELVSLQPQRYSRSKRATAPVHSNYVLLRGDTGEVVAQGEFVPGRASSAYAPSDSRLEQRLIRLREDRDPITGIKLPLYRRGEHSAEKIEWARAIALGSTIKPLLSRALELADPWFAASLELEGGRFSGARCSNGSHALLGHCAPNDSLWNYSKPISMEDYLAHSVNWYQAAVGLLGTAAAGGQLGFGSEGATPLAQALTANVGDHPTSSALWTSRGGRPVITSKHRLAIDGLRRTPMWRNFEALIGRSLCDRGAKARCKRARRDVCATRALPVAQPTADLRHLLAMGPSTFDFYPYAKDPNRIAQTVPIQEYFQFLRGGGVHSVGSLLQLADALNRAVYEWERDPGRDGPYQLAASWFPAPRVGQLPPWQCRGRSGTTPVARGLCASLTRGTARILKPLLTDRRIAVFAAKTGTTDSLAQVARRRDLCRRFREARTVSGVPAKQQPYWLRCGTKGGVDDSLIVISFGVRSEKGIEPFTLALRFQRSGSGFATRVARHYVDLVRAFYGAAHTGVATP